MGIDSFQMNSLVAARRMLVLAQQAELRRKDPHAKTKNLKEIGEEDEALLGTGNTGKTEGYERPKQAQDPNTDIHLDELLSRMKDLLKPDKGGTVEISAEQSYEVHTEIKISYTELAKVDGLVKRSNTQAETDRYALEFMDQVSFKITDKWTGRSTTIWGDPHVDTNDQEGSQNGEFSDLSGSDSHTTLQLMDGTRITFTAKDQGVIEAVDIFKGSQHLRGVGGGMQNAQPEDYYFSSGVDSASGGSIPQGDVVRAGGDGNDWFAPSGEMIWGQTTGPVVTARPDYRLEMEYRQEVIQKSSVTVRVSA
jgi:hypothetical protein